MNGEPKYIDLTSGVNEEASIAKKNFGFRAASHIAVV